MNAVEIDQAVSELFQEPFDAAEFAFQFLAAFDRNETTLNACAQAIPTGRTWLAASYTAIMSSQSDGLQKPACAASKSRS